MTAVTGQALEPLRARYAHWMGLDHDQVLSDREEAESDIRAMQLVLRMEREAVPSWHKALELAASAAAAICLDPRAEPEGEWYDAISAYCAGHIRKVTRRARGAHWAAIDELAGLTFADDSTELRVLLPGKVTEIDKLISRLQVGGTDAPIDEPLVDAGDDILRLWVPPEPVMTLGKAMAQTGHAGMIAAALLAEDSQPALEIWAKAGCPTRVRRVDATHWATLVGQLRNPAHGWQQDRLLAVRDAGFTEIAPGTITVIAQAPG